MEQNSPVVLLCYRQIPKNLELQMEIFSAYRLGLAKFQAIFWTEKKILARMKLFYKFMEV